MHLENVDWNWVVNGSNYSVTGTAHIDLYNPNSTLLGGGGLSGFAGHVSIDGIVGHLVEAFGGNLDPANCPW